MSETGATAREVMRAELIAAMEQHLGAEWSQQYEPRHFAGFVVSYIESELWNKGYQIVPAGAVVLSAEEAELGADGLSRLIARYESLANEHDRSGRTEQWLWEQNNAAKFSALAAKLSGGAS